MVAARLTNWRTLPLRPSLLPPGAYRLATTRSARLATGDPRKSLEERYKDHDGYVKEVTKAAEKLEKKRLLLPSDVKRYIDEADASHVLR